ncbi:MAG: hypothetical protein ACKOXL_07565 [Limnohabitans sp.]
MSRYREHSDGRVRMSRTAEVLLNWAAAIVLGLILGALPPTGF